MIAPSQVVQFIEEKIASLNSERQSAIQNRSHPASTYPRYSTSDWPSGISDSNFGAENKLLLSMINRIPENVRLFESESERSAFELALLKLESGGNGKVRIGATGQFFQPVELIRSLLKKIPDRPSEHESDLFDFVKSAKLRSNLLADHTEAHMALNAGLWKASTVLSGSVIEALLLDFLTEGGDVSETQTKFGLTQLVAKCRAHYDENDLESELGLIKEQIAQYRNLIHAGKVLRTKEDCTAGTAHIAFGAVIKLADAIKKFQSKKTGE